jgi:uncharacterized protein YaaQ
MRLIVAVVQGADATRVTDALVTRGFDVTRIDSTGGFLRERNATLLVGVADQHAAEAKRVIREHCQARAQHVNPLMPILEPADFLLPTPVEVVVGGATVFSLRVSRYERVT